MTSGDTDGGTPHDRQDSMVSRALEEMRYKTGVGNFGQDMSVSIPAQLRFESEPTQATRRFHVELGRRGYAPLDSDPDRPLNQRDDLSIHYNGEICSREHYKRMRIRVFRGNVVRLYPKDGWDVSSEELSEIIHAIETGFGAKLMHDPIERENKT